MAEIEAKIAPFINVKFYLTGAWGEQRTTHKHAGVDLSTGQKSNVYNMFKGTCIRVDHDGSTNSGYGAYIIIQEDSGRTWLYGDLAEFSSFSVGDTIEQGEQISSEGNPSGTGSTGYHVHVELEMLNKGDSFKFGYSNSTNPCEIMGLTNVAGTSNVYIYNGSPYVPPTPTETKKKKHKFPWFIYYNYFRNKY